ncbi:MAG: 30S ribosomal protein S4 [Candidatus Methanomethylophilaceae archaeon]|nr:30S ribosomal protein S4 [Candidatus Methanomethylophilaceae archaeon]NCA73343.1 30S ribosomal protein S4 [Gammaproteobacteria bacterium]
MGDPKFSRKTYDTPSHPWQGERIKAEHEVVVEFGLKNKNEVWKAQSILRNYRKQSRELQSRLRGNDAQARIEADNLISKCSRMGILPISGGDLNDVLVLNERDLLSRRLQTIVFEKGLASTIKQARQMINHGHIFLNGHRVTVPGYIVLRSEEPTVEYAPASAFTDEMHPMRATPDAIVAKTEAKAAVTEKHFEKKAKAAKEDAEAAGITAKDGEI